MSKTCEHCNYRNDTDYCHYNPPEVHRNPDEQRANYFVTVRPQVVFYERDDLEVDKRYSFACAMHKEIET